MSKNNKHTFSFLKEIIAALIIFCGAAFLIMETRWSRLYEAPALLTEEPVDIYLEEEVGLDKLEKLFFEKGIIEDRPKFRWAANILRWNRFQAGHYRFKAETSYDELFSKMGKGLQGPINFTLLPGQSSSSIKRKLYESFRFDSLSLSRTLTDSTFLAKHGIDSSEVIGHLHPDSYSFYWTTNAKQVVERIFKTFNQKITQKYSARLEELDISIAEAVTMASIIEWEAQNNDEKATISGLYWNRLERNMKLQADPTVNYAVGERRRLLYEDYRIDHPYNTYLHGGLPPGPITNPSQSSIEAALYPEDHDYLYMVAAPDGTHNFSKTFEEHKRKSAEWRKWLNEQYRIKAEREAGEDNDQ